MRRDAVSLRGCLVIGENFEIAGEMWLRLQALGVMCKEINETRAYLASYLASSA